MLWKIGGGLLVAGLLGLAIWLYGGARYAAGQSAGTSAERSLWQDKVVQAERDKLAAYQAGVRSVQTADARYVETIREKVVPITKTIVERTTAYAATPDGASICLAPDRVRWLEQTRSALFPPAPAAPAGRTDAAVQGDGPGNEPGRLNVEGASRAEPRAG